MANRATWAAGLVLCLILAGCGGRALAPGERAFAADVFGPGLDLDRVRVSRGAGVTTRERTQEPPPIIDEITPEPGLCDRVAPDPPEGPPPAWALYNRLHVVGEYYREDMMPNWPDRVLIPQVFLLAHELVHVWQWQNRRVTGYRPAKAALESVLNRDPYFYVPDEGGGFLEYGFEQQASLLEDYFCYAVFDPKNPRRAKLRGILEPYFGMDEIDTVLGR